MIVECRSCQTRFQLDESRIPLSGIRVRCSKCKEAFFLEHPSASEQEALEDVATRAAAGGRPPDSTQDLVDARPAASGLDDDEEDWEFNHDLPPEPARAAGSAAGAAGAAPVATPAVEDDASFGSIDDLGDLGGDDDLGDLSDDDFGALAAAASQTASAPAAVAPPAPARGTAAERIDSAIDAFAASGASEASRGLDGLDALEGGDAAPDLGEPEDWDLLGDDLSAPEAPVAFSAAPAASAPPAHMRPAVAAPRGPVGVDAFDVAPLAVPGWLQRAGAALGACVAIALFGAALARGLAPAAASGDAAGAFEVGPLRARSLGSVFIPVRGGRTLLAVTGELHNPTSAPVRPESPVWVELLDADGVALDLPAARAGSVLDPEMLRDLGPDERAQLQQGAFAAFAAGAVPAGRHVAFAAYFEDAPPGARRVAVRARDRAATSPSDLP